MAKNEDKRSGPAEISVIDFWCFSCGWPTRFSWEPERGCWSCEECGHEEPEGEEPEESR